MYSSPDAFKGFSFQDKVNVSETLVSSGDKVGLIPGLFPVIKLIEIIRSSFRRTCREQNISGRWNIRYLIISVAVRCRAAPEHLSCPCLNPAAFQTLFCLSEKYPDLSADAPSNDVDMVFLCLGYRSPGAGHCE